MAIKNAKRIFDVAAGKSKDPNTLITTQMGNPEPLARNSMGDRGADDVKTTGIKMRGSGAATKGFMSRGPMG